MGRGGGEGKEEESQGNFSKELKGFGDSKGPLGMYTVLYSSGSFSREQMQV